MTITPSAIAIAYGCFSFTEAAFFSFIEAVSDHEASLAALPGVTECPLGKGPKVNRSDVSLI
jgi:hypothetical protein